MLEEYDIVYEGGFSKITEKKSQFITTVFPIESEETALAYLEQIRKEHWNATHNCYAYVIGDNHRIQRFSDDGEPSGTAGKPILDVLLGEGIHNALIVVTRYFGGTLLGTGGLVKAYGQAAKEGLKNSLIVKKCLGKKVCITSDYTSIGKIQYIIAQRSLHILNTEYADTVSIELITPFEMLDSFVNCVVEATSGKAVFDIQEDLYYAKKENDIIILN